MEKFNALEKRIRNPRPGEFLFFVEPLPTGEFFATAEFKRRDGYFEYHVGAAMVVDVFNKWDNIVSSASIPSRTAASGCHHFGRTLWWNDDRNRFGWVRTDTDPAGDMKMIRTFVAESLDFCQSHLTTIEGIRDSLWHGTHNEFGFPRPPTGVSQWYLYVALELGMFDEVIEQVDKKIDSLKLSQESLRPFYVRLRETALRMRDEAGNE